MADTLATVINAYIQWNRTEALDLSNVIDSAKFEYSKSLADGTGSDQADIIWHDRRTLASATNDDLDLNALTQTIFGSTVTINFAKVKAIFIKNRSTTAGDELILDSSVTNAFTGPFNGSTTSKVEIGPDSILIMSAAKAGWTVTGGSVDVIRVRNPGGGTSIDYDIAILGTSA